MSPLAPDVAGDGALVVIVADCGIDACVVRNGEGNVLVVSPHQTFSSAVAAATRALDGPSDAAVRTLLRGHLPTTDLDLDEVLPGYSNRWMVHATQREERAVRWWVVLIGVIFTLLACFAAWATVSHVS